MSSTEKEEGPHFQSSLPPLWTKGGLKAMDEPGPSQGLLHEKLEGPLPDELSDAQCEHLASELRSNPNYRELDLSRYSLKESGVELLCAALRSPKCRLQVLRLNGCLPSERSCVSLISALKSASISLRELDLSGNKSLKDSGVQLLSSVLKNQMKALKILRLNNCGLSEKSCAVLALTEFYYLEELDLSLNNLCDSGIKLLFSEQGAVIWRLKKLRLNNCGLSEKSCAVLALTEFYYLEELDLSLNNLCDSGIKLLFSEWRTVIRRLKKLRLNNCGLSEKSCAVLALTEFYYLEELDLSLNNLCDSGIKLLFSEQGAVIWRLKKLRLNNCGLSEKSCAVLALTEFYYLEELDLSLNNLCDSGIKLLFSEWRTVIRRLKKLRLNNCGLSEKSCAVLASTEFDYLEELDLSLNNLCDSGIKLLFSEQGAVIWRLKKLR
ncbi:ribonuclease inhibitor-like [Echeneis naucrates]|uniref:Ribonuclease inhibitor-like n=1 Tax=Echeneis naucrates TaxID=173247 RepID=A0A665TGV2_ECHNA|nr:ribonuclease inhibitor-like [Echeneis naucrates]